MSNTTRSEPRVAIIGSGFAGICLAIQLKKAGIDSFTIYEKADKVGGTWRDNTYPGAACDSPAFAYCFSFEQKTDWSHKWVLQPEILSYIEHCVDKYDLRPHLRLGCELESARFDAAGGFWRLRIANGESVDAEVLVSGVGQLNRPILPNIEGLGDFRGASFHSARWNHDFDLTGKRVAVIGNAASAVQFVPEIAPKVESLYLFQRSANWMLPRGNRPFTSGEKWRLTHLPLLARLYRWWLWGAYESRFPVFRQSRYLTRKFEKVSLGHLDGQIADPELRRLLRPDYPIGGKRILVSDDYYPALTRENLRLITTPIERITADGVAVADGRRFPADALILATGFDSTSFLAPMDLEGLNGKRLRDLWRRGAEAYLGISVAGFPNFFMMYGPNTNLGHNSIIFMIECQTRYIVDCIRQLKRRRLRYLDVREEAMQTYNERLQAALEKTVWATTDRSWYKTADGKITNNWSGPTVAYWWRTRRADLQRYHQVSDELVSVSAGAVSEASR